MNSYVRYVFICSPYSPTPERDLQSNIYLAKQMCKMACLCEYIPLAPHLYFTNFLDDNRIKEREIGIAMGIEWMKWCCEVWVPEGLEYSPGMKRELANKGDLPVFEVDPWNCEILRRVNIE